ncbi:MAG: hypothetical protein HYT07_03190 [Candidatus Levybacteria bacterium]|nr:hypothetical protein [Candidatus Levybacteria bacterium]
MGNYVLDISKVDKRDVDHAGQYAAQLGELSRIRVPVPEGFVVTTNCFREFLIANKLYSISSTEKQVMHASMPEDMASQVHDYYSRLGNRFKENAVIATPSSPFSFKNIHYEVKGDANLIVAIKEIWAAQFKKITLLEIGSDEINNLSRLDIAVAVQKKVNSRKSGTMFTEDPLTSDKTKIVIEEDGHEHSRYVLSKKDLRILFKSHQTHVKKSHQLSDIQARTLSHIGILLQKHFYFPQEIKFSIDRDIIYILSTKQMANSISESQSFPSTPGFLHHPKLNHQKSRQRMLLKGVSTFPGITTGPVRIFKNYRIIHNVNPSEILVVPKIETSLFHIIRKAKGFITETASFTDHDKMIYGKIVGKPMIQGVIHATSALHTGSVVTLDGAKGEVYKGGLN